MVHFAWNTCCVVALIVVQSNLSDLCALVCMGCDRCNCCDCVYECRSVTAADLLNISLVVAENLGSKEQCIKLAAALKVSLSEMNKLRFLHYSAYQEIHAIDMMNSWRAQIHSPSAAYVELRLALSTIKRSDIIQLCHQHELLK